jgi:hypothetical protein
VGGKGGKVSEKPIIEIQFKREGDETWHRAALEEVSIIDLAKAIFSDRIADGPHTVCAEIIAQFPGGLWRIT